ncbi:MAG: hypothetical protein AB7V46_21240, partial [Thermomicrobiales bacterium]
MISTASVSPKKPPSDKHGLLFNQSPPRAEQQLLFDTSPLLFGQQGRGAFAEVPESLYTDGYALFRDVSSPEAAQGLVESVISHCDPHRLAYAASILHGVKLAKVDRIPVCDDIVARSYQALHYDMGLPLGSDSNQSLYLFVALYAPFGAEAGTASTRVVFVPHLLQQQSWASAPVVDGRLVAYLEKYGDGWYKPTAVNTYRIACFARIIDAVTSRHELVAYVDKTTGDWFRNEPGEDGTMSLRNEIAFFQRCGLDLERVEKRFCLQPGELLLVDNVRAVHGRIGRRRREEIYQFLYGVPSITPHTIA